MLPRDGTSAEVSQASTASAADGSPGVVERFPPLRSFAAKAAWYAGGYALRSLFFFAALYVVTHVVKVDRYGVYGEAQAIGALLGTLATFGMPMGLGAWLVRHPQGEERARLLWNALWSSGLVALLCLGVVVPLLAVVYPWLDPARAGVLLLGLALGEAARGAMAVLKVQMDWDEDVRGRFWLDLAGTVAAGALSCVCVLAGLDVLGLAYGTAAGVVLVAGVFLVRARSRYPVVFDPEGIRRTLLMGKFFLVASLCLVALTSVDRLILARLLGEREVGLYNVALQVATAFAGIPVALASMMDRHVFRGGVPSPERLRAPLEFSLLFPALYALLAVAATPLFFRFLVGEEYLPAYRYVPALVGGMGLVLFMGFGWNAYCARGRVVLPFLHTLAALAVSVGCNSVLIPRIGIWGAVVSLAVAYLWLGGAMLLFQGLVPPSRWALLGAVRVAAFWAACAAAGGWILVRYGPVQWFQALASGLAASVLLVGLFGCLPRIGWRTDLWGWIRHG